MTDETPEEWRPVVGYEGLYEVSDLGRVRSSYFKRTKILKPVFKGRGYPAVNLYKDRVATQVTLHRLVMLAFTRAPDSSSMHVLHGDGDMLNNHLSNLRWGTHAENMADMILHGTSANQNTRKTHCKSGHEFTKSNTYVNRKGARICRICHQEYSRDYWRNHYSMTKRRNQND